MLLLISPAKSLDFDTPAPGVPHTQPRFPDQAAELIGLLRQKSPQDIAELMDLSDALSTLNADRYQAFKARPTARHAKQAALAFDGDVYGGLQAGTLPAADLRWAQRHLRILSGLYGLLRPLDRIQPHRLEMGTALANAHGGNLYQFWGSRIAEQLNADLGSARSPVVVNLASQEYFRSVDRKALRARVVECVFEEYKSGVYKVISFPAKRARGLMARHVITQRITTPTRLRGFDAEGYAFDAEVSAPDRLVFRRRTA